jgi:hypothetical protein
MIQMPRRSVTRFFIPLIDVLILLFCLFMLMPMIGGAPDADAGKEKKAPPTVSKDNEAELRKLRAEIERLRKEKGRELLRRLAVRVLEIDARTGKLYYRDPDLLEVRNQDDARDLIDRDRRALGTRELYYLILYPRTRSAYPTREQLENYRRWFAGVALGYDRPGARPGGTQP